MKAVLWLFIMQLLSNYCYMWDVEYVGKQLVLPIANATQETLFCVCSNCFDDNLDELMKLLQTTTMKPQLVVSQQLDLRLQNSDIKRHVLTLIVAKEFQDLVFKIHYEMVKGRHFYVNIILMLEPVEDFRQVVAMVRYLYEEKFVNTDVYYVNGSNRRQEVFSYDAYPAFAVINKTHLVGDVHKFYYKIVQKSDLKGYRFETPLMQDPPKVIKYKNGEDEDCIQGVTFNIIKIMLAYLNGTLKETELDYNATAVVNMKYVLEQVRQQKVEFAAHAYALFQNDERVQKSYPLLVVNWCLMVPIFNKEFTMFYPFYPFNLQVWLMVLLAFALINVVNYAFFKRQDIETKNILLTNFCKFINATPPKPCQNPTKLWFDMILNGFIFTQGFFLTAFYTSMLGSILAVTVIRKQIETMADLLQAQLPIMIIDYELKFLLKADFRVPRKFLQLIRPVNSSTFYQHQFRLNTSYGYFTTYDTWHFLNLQQRHMRPPLFRYSNICFGDYHLAFPMITESPIWHDVENLMLHIHSSGLYFYHEKKSFEYAVLAGLVKSRGKHSSFQTVGFKHLRLVLVFWAFGLLLALLQFLYELWQNRRVKRNR